MPINYERFCQNIARQGRQIPNAGKVSSMLCTLVKAPPHDPDYLYEIKWDGYRIISYVDGNKIRLDSRSAKNYTTKYPPVAAALKALKHRVIQDGEMVVFTHRKKK